MALCPICGRTIGTYTNDPILATPSLSDEQYKGFTVLLAQHIKELQDERHQQELDAGISPLTNFSVIDTTNLFQDIKQYILELRTSTEAVLIATGMSKHDYLSLDENGNALAVSKDNWTDSNLEEIKYQCKAIHIEDLRHFISVGWTETFDFTPMSGRVAYAVSGGYTISGYPSQWSATDFLLTPLYGDYIWSVNTMVNAIFGIGGITHYSLSQASSKFNLNLDCQLTGVPSISTYTALEFTIPYFAKGINTNVGITLGKNSKIKLIGIVNTGLSAQTVLTIDVTLFLKTYTSLSPIEYTLSSYPCTLYFFTQIDPIDTTRLIGGGFDNYYIQSGKLRRNHAAGYLADAWYSFADFDDTFINAVNYEHTKSYLPEPITPSLHIPYVYQVSASEVAMYGFAFAQGTYGNAVASLNMFIDTIKFQ